MKQLPLAGAFAIALVAASPAFAANTQTQTPQTTPKVGAAVDPDEMKSLGQNNLSQQLRDQLTKAGYSSIKVMPSSFYVQAKDKKGDPVAMVIGPDTFTEVTEVKTQASNETQPNASAQHTAPSATQQK